MRASGIFGDAFRNALTGTSRAGLLAITVAAIAVLLATIDMVAIHAQQEQARRFDSSGATIRVLSIEQRIDPRSCDALSKTTDIAASGAISPAPAITLAAVPRNPVPSYSTTTGFARLLGIDRAREGVWIPEGLAQSLGVNPSDVLDSDRGRLTIAGVYVWPDDGRDARLRYAILSPTLEGKRFDECWARMWPYTTEADDIIRTAAEVTSSGGETLTLAQVNNSLGSVYDSHAAYINRPTAVLWWGSVAAAGVIGFVAARRRRLEYASAQHAGQRKIDQLAVNAVETIFWATVGAAIASGSILVIAARLSLGTEVTLATVQIPGPVLMIVGATIGSLMATAMTRERHLFSYFKDRG